MSENVTHNSYVGLEKLNQSPVEETTSQQYVNAIILKFSFDQCLKDLNEVFQVDKASKNLIYSFGKHFLDTIQFLTVVLQYGIHF